jgi:hypothetical protein
VLNTRCVKPPLGRTCRSSLDRRHGVCIERCGPCAPPQGPNPASPMKHSNPHSGADVLHPCVGTSDRVQFS